MNIYDRYLPQLVIDYSVLHSFLYNMSVSVILLSPGGCNQPIREVDEYRDFTKTNQYTTKLNDAQITLGIEEVINERLLFDLDLDVDFIAVIGTAITNIIGTNLSMVSKKIESLVGKPVVFFNTNGFEFYPKAISEAYLKVLPFILEENFSTYKKKVNLIGFHPMIYGSDQFLIQLLDTLQHDQIQFCLPGLMNFEKAHSKLSKDACVSIILSGEGVKLGEQLKEMYDIPYEMLIPISESGMKDLFQVLEKYTGQVYPKIGNTEDYFLKNKYNERSILIIGEPLFSIFLRKALKRDFGIDGVQILSLLPKEVILKGELSEVEYGDIIFNLEEDAFFKIVQGADVIIGDPLLKETMPQMKGKAFIDLPYFGLSGREYAKTTYNYMGSKGFEYFKNELIKME